MVGVSVAVVAAAQAPAKPKPDKGKAGKAVIEGEEGKRLDAKVLAFDKDAGGFCGSVIVAAKGKVLLEKGYGLADEAAKTPLDIDAQWDWASVSKQFTAAAVLKLQDQKKLKIDDPISKFYKDAPKDKAGVTLRQLLQHVSGIESGFKREWNFDAHKREALEQCILKLPMTSKPGEKFEYSNSGYAFLAAIIERVSGKSYEEYCIDNLFKPSGMKDTCFIGWKALDLARVPKIERGKGFTDRPQDFRFAYGNTLNWGYRGCGGVVATTHDMFLWDRALRGEKLLSAAAKEDLYKPGVGNYALGWEVRKTPHGLRVEHSGGVMGVVTYYLRLIDEDVVVATAMSYTPKDHPQHLADSLAEIAGSMK